MGLFEAYIQLVLAKEAGYSDNPNDSGGPTNYGITQARAKAAGYTGDMRQLQMDQAVEIYRLFYWRQPMFDAVAEISPGLAALCLDLGINLGTTWPGRFVQRALNVLNDRELLYRNVTPDGVMGAMTRAALSSFLERRGSRGLEVLINMVRAQASVRYIEIAEGSLKNEDFEYGWQDTRAFPISTLHDGETA